MGILKKIKKRIGHRKDRHYGWHGDYPSWDAACARTTGFDSAEILTKVRVAALAVKNGDAVFERDSVLFDRADYNWPLIASLNWIAARSMGKLHVLDFGGSLGSTWFQNQIFLEALDVIWSVVEQPHFVTVGRKDFANERLFFKESIDDVLSTGSPNVFLASSVIQYLDDPFIVLDPLRNWPFPFVIFDRTAMTDRSTSRITVQHVPEQIYPASYPTRFMTESELLAPLLVDYNLVADWQSVCDKVALEHCDFKGFLLERNSNS